MFEAIVKKIKILPVLIILCGFSLIFRIDSFMTGLSEYQGGTAMAEEQEDEFDAIEEMTTETPDQGNSEMAEMPKEMPEEADENIEEKWKDFADTDLEYSELRTQLIEDLSKRRRNLESKEKELLMREALLQAAEKEVDQKIQELESVRFEIEALLQTQSEEERKRIQSLIKIYEGMKAKDAARIFNTLDLDVLLAVLTGMSERKSAPIIAAMQPERARTVTIMMAEQKQLPNLDDVTIQ